MRGFALGVVVSHAPALNVRVGFVSLLIFLVFRGRCGVGGIIVLVGGADG